MAGWGPGDGKELSCLGRTIRLDSDVVTMEGDDMHVTRLQEEWDMQTCSAVSTPYVNPLHAPDVSATKDLPSREAAEEALDKSQRGNWMLNVFIKFRF